MSLQAWMLIFQAVEAAVIIVGAFYLNNMVREQRAAKDATIETKNALIEHLKAVSAPALVRDLRDLNQYANEMATKNRKLQLRNRQLSDVASKLSDLRYRLGFVHGLGEGRAALRLVFGAVVGELREQKAQGLPPMLSPKFMDNIMSYMNEMTQLNVKVLDGQKPEPAFGPRADEQDRRLGFTPETEVTE